MIDLSPRLSYFRVQLFPPYTYRRHFQILYSLCRLQSSLLTKKPKKYAETPGKFTISLRSTVSLLYLQSKYSPVCWIVRLLMLCGVNHSTSQWSYLVKQKESSVGISIRLSFSPCTRSRLLWNLSRSWLCSLVSQQLS